MFDFLDGLLPAGAIQGGLAIRIGFTLLVAAVYFGGRSVGLRMIRRDTTFVSEDQRRQIFLLKSTASLGLAIALVAIWITQLQSIALSLTAVLVAVVIATKEILMCVSGFLLRTSNRLFSVGDWIEVNGVRGEVSDHSVLSTTILEVEPSAVGHAFTGRIAVVPNSLFLTHAVRNESFRKNYVLHSFELVVDNPAVDGAAALTRLESIVDEATLSFREVARRYANLIERKLGEDIPGPEPMIAPGTTEIGKPRFRVTVFCPTPQAAEIERRIAGGFLALLSELARGAQTPAPALSAGSAASR